MPYSLSELNRMSQEEFVAALGAVYEHTPAIADRAWYQRPFMSVVELHQRTVDEVNAMGQEEQLVLIQAHPDLGSRGKMAEASAQEQAGVGLDRLTPPEYEQLQAFNQAYREKFGFPFVVAVKHYTKTSILAAFEHRLENTAEIERQQALAEITQIAWVRLTQLVSTDDNPG